MLYLFCLTYKKIKLKFALLQVIYQTISWPGQDVTGPGQEIVAVKR